MTMIYEDDLKTIRHDGSAGPATPQRRPDNPAKNGGTRDCVTFCYPPAGSLSVLASQRAAAAA